MSPEAPGNLVVLDLRLRDSSVECQVDRYDPEAATGWLKVSWNAIQCPPGYVPIGGGVVFVWAPPGYTHRTYRASPDDQSPGRFGWVDKVYGDGLMLVIVLPTGYVLPSVQNANPAPVRAKDFKGRMALYWLIQGSKNDVQWDMQHEEVPDIVTRCGRLNEEAVRQFGRSIQKGVVVDEIPTSVSRFSSKREPVDPNPPSWHEERAIAPMSAKDRLLKLITQWTFFTGILISLIGLVFIFAGPSGDTSFELFGNSFKSTHVGIAAIFIGVVMIVLNIRRILRVVERE